MLRHVSINVADGVVDPLLEFTDTRFIDAYAEYWDYKNPKSDDYLNEGDALDMLDLWSVIKLKGGVVKLIEGVMGD